MSQLDPFRDSAQVCAEKALLPLIQALPAKYGYDNVLTWAGSPTKLSCDLNDDSDMEIHSLTFHWH